MMLARDLLVQPLRALHNPTVRRLLVLLALAIALFLVVTGLYDHAEPPGATQAALAMPAANAAPAKPAARPSPPARAGTPAPSAKPAGGEPGEVAAAWYAAQHHLGLDQVRPLQQQRVGANQVRVLVMAAAGGSRLESDFVNVTRTASGWVVR